MSTSPQRAAACAVSGARSLPEDTGGEGGVCEAIGRVLADRPDARVEVEVVSKSHMTAVVVLADGRKLPAVSTVVADGMLSARSVRMLADAIGAQLRSIGS